MLLAIDVGNTHITVGAFRGKALLHTWRLNTNRHYTSDELGIQFLRLVEKEKLTGVCIASVVPSLDEPLQRMSREFLRQKPLMVGPKTKLGITNLYNNPEEVGADRLVNAVAVHTLYRK